MKTVHFNLQDRERAEKIVQTVAKVLEDGGSIVYPTDTSYGLGVNAFSETAIEKIFLIKERARQKPISVAVRDIAMAKRIAVVSAAAEKFLARVWPGAVTVVLPRRSNLPEALTDGKPVGMRCPKHTFHKMLFGFIDFPVTATSANISGEGSIFGIEDLRAKFKNKKYLPDLVINAGSLAPSQPSTVVDLTGKELKILRVGPVSLEELTRLFNELR